MPAGKAIAIAAMPTAVLMGMGLTPTLAQAKGLPKNPFQDGPCVTAPDTAGQDADDKKAADDAEKKAEKGKAAKDKADKADKDEAGKDGQDKKDGSGGTDGGAPADDGGKSGGGGGSSDPGDPGDDGGKDTGPGTGEPSPEPSRSKPTNPLDPLGLGDALRDILGGGKDKGGTDDGKDGPEESASPTPSASPKPSPSGGDKSDPVRDTVDKVTGAAKDTADKAGDAVKDAADKAGDKTGDKDGKDKASPSPSPSATDPMAPDENGKKPFPCVVEKKVDGKGETTPAVIPNQPWFLDASSLTLKGADYKGIVNLTMPNGKTKQVMKYVVSSGVDIGDLHQTLAGPGGKTYHVQAAKGSTSTIRGGDVTMYTEQLQGKLFGLIPVTFDPEHPPPVNIPLIFVTDVHIRQAAQFGGNLTVPGLHSFITD
ncbi:hypothetical protein [Streptomyces sp. NPDC058045]|uniref:hypothetical protein n=1 Tax=Streptomyces sp. NPDC058045 TaxID=3346311 RepID=UPI0036ECA6F0